MGSLASPVVVKNIIEKYGFRFKKALGQNFLIDRNVVTNICKTADLKKSDLVVEIGPGIGTLTEQLAHYAGHVIAVELDKDLIGILEENLRAYGNVTIIQNDILKMNLDKVVGDFRKEHDLAEGPYKVVANLPYYITTPVLMYLMENNFNISEIVVMIQKEVAERIAAQPGSKDYGALSLAVRYYTEPALVMRVPRTVFIPKPEVDSAVIKLKRLSRPPVEVKDEELLFRIIRAAFGQRRKTLLNSLRGGLGCDKEVIKKALTQVGINPERRGETLTLQEFAALSNIFSNLLD